VAFHYPVWLPALALSAYCIVLALIGWRRSPFARFNCATRDMITVAVESNTSQSTDFLLTICDDERVMSDPGRIRNLATITAERLILLSRQGVAWGASQHQDALFRILTSVPVPTSVALLGAAPACDRVALLGAAQKVKNSRQAIEHPRLYTALMDFEKALASTGPEADDNRRTLVRSATAHSNFHDLPRVIDEVVANSSHVELPRPSESQGKD
jgi:hypothetical protein